MFNYFLILRGDTCAVIPVELLALGGIAAARRICILMCRFPAQRLYSSMLKAEGSRPFLYPPAPKSHKKAALHNLCAALPLLTSHSSLLTYPSATSRVIMTMNPKAKEMTPMSECSPSDISGISSSTTTYIMAPAAKDRR